MNKLTEIHRNSGAVMGMRNGVEVPLSYHTPEEEHLAVRKHILLSDYSHFGMASIDGESAYELLNQIVAGDVSSIRDEQAMYTVILNDQAEIVTDLYILCDDEQFILLSEWKTGEELCDLLRSALEGREDEFDDIGEIRSLNDQWGILHFEGPYCWELLAEKYGIDVVGLPFHEHMHVDDDLILFRAGKHGEFSYKLLGDRDVLAEIWNEMLELGEKYDLRTGGLNYQRQVRLENPCWEPDVCNAFSKSPIELQMQWTVRYDKEQFTGMDALVAQLEDGIKHRVVGMMIDGEPANLPKRGDKVCYQDQEIGQVIQCGYSADLNACIGRVLLNADYGWVDIDRYEIVTEQGRVAFKTAAVPFARNFSFLVNPSEHSYVDPSRPRDLLEQLERQKQKEQEQAEQTAEAGA